MFIEYASHWSYTIDELLQQETTNSAFILKWLPEEDCQTTAWLLKLCPLIDKKGPETPPQTHAIIIDLMVLVL